MTLDELMIAFYAWGDANAVVIFLASLALPVVGTLLAWIGRGGRTDADGRFIASTVMAAAMLLVMLELFCVLIAYSVKGASLLQANALLLAAPVVCLAGSIYGIRMVFPLSQLGSVKSASDMGTFLLACLVVVWLFSKFRGWGVIFFGSTTQLVVLLVLGFYFLRRLYRRAFGLDRRPASPLESLRR